MNMAKTQNSPESHINEASHYMLSVGMDGVFHYCKKKKKIRPLYSKGTDDKNKIDRLRRKEI